MTELHNSVLCVSIFINTLPWCNGHRVYFSFTLAAIKDKEESPVDMDTITLDPEEEVRRWSIHITVKKFQL